MSSFLRKRFIPTSPDNTTDLLNPQQLLNELRSGQRAISVTGLGYVGLPLALELARYFRVIGFDKAIRKIEKIRRGEDPNKELDRSAFADRNITYTHDPAGLAAASVHIVAVPTPVDSSRTPNLDPLLSATREVGKQLHRGDVVVFESTVYPGCTEEDCIPVLERESGLRLGEFTVGYSPERINPGDKEHTVTSIVKVVSGSDEATLELLAGIYGDVITAGIYRAKSIKIAEAAKVVENSQRDVNISFVNELSMIFNRMGIDTQEVLETASTKWNFLPFRPGLVGGHCISVDPYYLLHKSVELGYDPQVIASGRRVNDRMPAFVAKQVVQYLLKAGRNPSETRVLVLGVAFKENVTDIRNSKVVDVVRELVDYGVNVEIHDPLADPEQVRDTYDLTLSPAIGHDYDAIVVAVAHDAFRHLTLDDYRRMSKGPLLLFDLKALYDQDGLHAGELLWRL